MHQTNPFSCCELALRLVISTDAITETKRFLMSLTFFPVEHLRRLQPSTIPMMYLQRVALMVIPLAFSGASHLRRVQEVDYQPQSLISVEGPPPRKVWGSISMPEGSPWCNGHPTYWLVGHETKEAPWCLIDGQWTQPRDNLMEGPFDRHNCATLDVNQDGVPDILCGLGAVSGTGFGYNEVYVTNITDGSLTKTEKGHGLDKYPTMRNRFMKTLRGADGSDLVFLATKGTVRVDGEPNNHRMFRLHHPSDGGFRFREVFPRPWSHHTEASCLQIVDLNLDGLDDILLCNQKARGIAFIQQQDGSWETVRFHGSWAYNWRSARVVDVNGDGIKDLVVVGFGGQTLSEPESYVRMFRGIAESPYFDVTRNGLFFARPLSYASPDLEVLDVNSDGSPDIYIVQTNQWERGTYCAAPFNKSEWWETGYNKFVPPLDAAPDVLLIGGSPTQRERPMFELVNMTHSEPGCGSFVETFGNNRTLVLAQGARDRPGHNLLLHW